MALVTRKWKKQHLKKHVPKGSIRSAREWMKFRTNTSACTRRKFRPHSWEISRSRSQRQKLGSKRRGTCKDDSSVPMISHQRIRKAKRVLANIAGRLFKVCRPQDGVLLLLQSENWQRSVKSQRYWATRTLQSPSNYRTSIQSTLCSNCP